MKNINRFHVLSMLYALKYRELLYNEHQDKDSEDYSLIKDYVEDLQSLGINITYTETPTQIHTNALTQIKKYQ